MSVKAGYGHHSTAQAMISVFEEMGWECEMMDVFKEISPDLSESINDWYGFATKYLKNIYGKVYCNMAKREDPYPSLSPLQITSKIISTKMRKSVEEYRPDVVIGTHSFAAMIMSVLRSKSSITCPTIGIVTDFMIHPLWESTDIDYYVLPSSMLKLQMMKKGIPENKIIATGIPVKREFSLRTDKTEARKKLGIPDKKTVLVMMGSMGFGNMEKFMNELDCCRDDFTVLCVCGTNEKMKNEISSKLWRKNVKVYGFVNNVHEMMDTADILITKPGGLTTSEALAKGLPCVITNPIPGQEDMNMEFLVNNGCAIMVSDTYRIDEAMYWLFNFDWRIDLMKQAVSHMGKPNAARDLYEFVHELTKKPEYDEVSV